MGSEVCLILHRKSANEPAIKEAVKHVRGQGVDLDVRVPWNKKAKRKSVKEAIADGAKRIIAGGGDGTINGVVNALVGKGKKRPKATMGVLPLGTANDFAHGLGLPCDDLKKCLEIASTTPAKKIDVGRANKRCFINVTSGGFGAEITATTPVGMKKALGGGAYTLMGLVKAFGLQPYTGRLLIPGQDPIEGSMLFMGVGNSRLAGGGFEIAPKAKLDDGLLDLAVINAGKGADLMHLSSELEDPENPNNRVLRYWQLPDFTIAADREVHFNLDGEPTTETELHFSVLPRHLGVAF
jgi:lipid kinase YegS